MNGPEVEPHYEIRVRGRLSAAALASFDPLDARVARSETVLCGPVRDQAGLYGLLERVRELGLELLAVRRI